MKAILIGCIDFSYEIMSTLLQHRETVQIVGVVTKTKSNFNSDFKSLEPLAKEYDIPTFNYEKETSGDLPGWLRAKSPDIAFCIGWSNLLNNDILNIPRLGVIGYHPAALPQNRGRHPLIWTLALGLPEVGSSFFIMDAGADTGDLVSQRILPVKDSDNAANLYRKITAAAKEQIVEIAEAAANNRLERKPQDHSRANSWRKRGMIDGQIDWRMSAKNIHNLVRALARPYPGAHCLVEGAPVKIWKTAIINENPLNLEPGKVLKRDGNKLRIKCGEGCLEVIEHEFQSLPQVGDYL